MRLETILRILLVAVIVFPLVGAMIDSFAPGLLPPELAAYSETQLDSPMRAIEWVYLGLVVPLLVSTVGLWLFKPWSRWLYTAVTVAAFLLAPFEPAWVGSSLSSTLNDLGTTCDGAVLALIWFSDLRGRFGS